MTSTGSGQKLCRLLNFTRPASYIFWIPGMSEMRIPWPSSTYSKPRLMICCSILSPSVLRDEFQQVENAITLNGRGQWRRRALGGLGLTQRLLATLHAHARQHEERNLRIANGGNGQGRSHSNQIGKTRHAQARDRHQADEAQHEHSRHAAAQIIGRAFLHDRVRQTEVHRKSEGVQNEQTSREIKIWRSRETENGAGHDPDRSGARSCTIVFAKPKFIESPREFRMSRPVAR